VNYEFVDTGIEVNPVDDVIVISVKISGDGHVGLMSTKGVITKGMYEIVLGANNNKDVLIR
jgi:hypothetical protein